MQRPRSHSLHVLAIDRMHKGRAMCEHGAHAEPHNHRKQQRQQQTSDAMRLLCQQQQQKQRMSDVIYSELMSYHTLPPRSSHVSIAVNDHVLSSGRDVPDAFLERLTSILMDPALSHMKESDTSSITSSVISITHQSTLTQDGVCTFAIPALQVNAKPQRGKWANKRITSV